MKEDMDRKKKGDSNMFSSRERYSAPAQSHKLEPEPPHFFKVFLNESVRDSKLGIPRKFVRKYGSNLSSPVTLKVPSGQIWKVGLTKIDGVFYLENGWHEFAEFYSVGFGDFLVFRYEGNSHFYVVIFDKSTTEIEYPFHGNFDEEELQRPQMEESETDVSLEMLDNISPCGKRTEKTTLNVHPRKKMKTDSAQGPEIVPNLRKEGIQDSDQKMFDEKSERTTGGSDFREKVGSIFKAPLRKKTLRQDEKIRALKRASIFKSKNPYFMKVMQPGYVRKGADLAISPLFAKKIFTEKHGYITLRAANGRSWPVKYNSVGSHFRLCSGWASFAQDNNLEVGDVCVFELIRKPEISFQVVIFRVNEDPHRHRPFAYSDKEVRAPKLEENEIDDIFQSKERREKEPLAHTLQTKKAKSIITKANNKNFNAQKCIAKSRHEGNQPNHHVKLDEDSKRYGGGESVSTPEKSRRWNPQCRRESLTKDEKFEALERAGTFKSQNPFFVLVIQPSHLMGAQLSVPAAFAKKYMNKMKEDITLRVSEGRSWLVNCCFKEYSGGRERCKLNAGSFAFVRGNNLEVGDVCVFELISRRKVSFRVVIYRATDAADCHPPVGSGSKANQVKCNAKFNSSSTNKVSLSRLSDQFNQKSQLPRRNIKIEPSECKSLMFEDSGRRPLVRRLSASNIPISLDDASKFNSEYPYFKVAVKPYNLQKGQLVLPITFSNRFIESSNENLLLQVGKKAWPVKLISCKDGTFRLSAGFPAFARENALQTGDICVFEMVNKNATMFKVSIFRCVV